MNRYYPLLTLPLVAVFAVLADIPAQLGAHPWWSAKVVWIGLFAGFAAASVGSRLGIGRTYLAQGFAVLSIAAFGTAYIGKSRFATSFAEDMFAGQLWYFGWIATSIFVFATLATLAWRRHSQLRKVA